jgi:hypothetical protein
VHRESPDTGNPSLKGIVVNFERVITGNRPVVGWAAFVRAAAMQSPGAAAANLKPMFLSCTTMGVSGRNAGSPNPGEGTA